MSVFPFLLDCGLLELRHMVITVNNAKQSMLYTTCSIRHLTIWNQKNLSSVT